jgi:probable HAF family extracellular repeat protein
MLRNTIAAAVLAGAGLCAAQDPPRFRLVDLGPRNQPECINASGVTAGSHWQGTFHAAFGTSREGWTLLEGGSDVRGIDDAGDMAGVGGTNLASTALYWPHESRQPVQLTVPGALAVYAEAVTTGGRVAGEADFTNVTRCVLWTNGAPAELSGTPGAVCLVAGINSSGQVAITAGNGADDQALVWFKGTTTSLGTLGGQEAAYAINELGHVAMQASLPPDPKTHLVYLHAAFWDGEKLVDIGALLPDDSAAFALNNHDDVVGYSAYNATRFHTKAFLYTSGRAYNLETLIVGDHHDWGLGSANGITDNGVIVGNGFKGLRAHGWMLVPLDPLH